MDDAFTDLAIAPREVGYPLLGTRRGDWAMRVLEYRIEYRILGPNDKDVVVFSVLHRADAYPPTRR